MSVIDGKVILIFAASEAGDANVIVFGVPVLSLNKSPEYAMVFPDNVIVFTLVATTVVSILRVFPLLSRGAVTCTCPAPENCEKEIAVVPTLIGASPAVCNT